MLQPIRRNRRGGPRGRAGATDEPAQLGLGKCDIEGQVRVAATGQPAHELRMVIEPCVELASDRECLVQPGRVAERASHLSEVRRGTDRQTVADAHLDVALRLLRNAPDSRAPSRLLRTVSRAQSRARAMLEYMSVHP